MAKKFKNSKVLGIDINERRIKDCMKFSESEGIENLKFAVANLENLNYSDEFDLVLAVDVMEHIENDVKVFENFHRAMKKGWDVNN